MHCRHRSESARRSHPARGRRRILMAGLLIVVFGLPAGPRVPAAAAEPPVPSAALFGTARQFPLISGERETDPAPRIAVRSASADAVELVFELPAITVQEISLDGQSYQLLQIAGGSTAGREGAPMLPTFSRLLQIPDIGGAELEITAYGQDIQPSRNCCPTHKLRL